MEALFLKLRGLTSNPVKARETLTSIFDSVESHQGALGGLFRGELSRRIAWHRGQGRDRWELSLAGAYLDRRDYLRAAIFFHEAWISREVGRQHRDVNEWEAREDVRQRGKRNDSFNTLSKLRNAMAHGVKATDTRLLNFLQDESKLRSKLREIRKQLFE